ncbi:MAG: hypothetical protein ACRDRS_23375 [Pseudonocardiaceae bacterium]
MGRSAAIAGGASVLSRITGVTPPPSGTVAVVMSEQELIVNAGRESVRHAIEAASALDLSALEHLHDAAQRAARAYYITPPRAMFTDLVHLRDTVYEQLGRTHKPRQQAELYSLVGLVCGLLSSVSWDLGYTEVAEEQARAAHTYGSVIDYLSLCAWVRALQATVMFWTARPRCAASLAATALETAPVGTARVRLHSVHARSLALIGARQGVRAALGDGDQAEIEAIAALALFGEMPERSRWAAGELGAGVDLAAARTCAVT